VWGIFAPLTGLRFAKREESTMAFSRGPALSTPTPTPGRRRVKKRTLIPVIMLGLVLALFLWAYVRGTWADTVTRNPDTSAMGAVTQLYRTPQCDVQIRSAILIDAPAASVWAVVRDYGNHPRFLPYVSAMAVQPQEGDRMYLTGVVHSRLWGDWPFAVHVDHKTVADKEYSASWDEPSETMAVNRGGWTLTATGPNQTLVVYTLQVEAAGYPNFFVRNLVLDRVSSVVSGLRDEVKRRQAGT
jgi:ribosome-associated toxin RatA of RatAB toxin-antitoxin module